MGGSWFTTPARGNRLNGTGLVSQTGDGKIDYSRMFTPLTTKTMDLVESLKKKTKVHQNRDSRGTTDDLINNILNNASAREKYGSFLAPGKNWTLPTQYKKLLEQFQKLDELLQFFKSKGNTTFWPELVRSFNATIQDVKLELDVLKRIIHVLPGCFLLSWEKNEKNNKDWDLHIDFPNNENSVSFS